MQVIKDNWHAGGGISLAPNGMRVLSRLGLTEQLAGQVGEELLDFNLLGSEGETIVSFKQRSRERYGHPAVGFRRYRLRAALLEAARREPGVTIHTGHRLVSLDCGEAAASAAAATGSSSSTSSVASSAAGPRPATLVFENGASFTADLVVGCDGIRSRVRAAVRGADEPPPSYTGTEEVICITRGRNEDLVPPSGLNLILGTGPRQFGTYGVGPEVMWFASRRRPESRDSWGAVKTPQEQEAVRRELLEEFKGWTLVEQLVQRDVDIMMRVGIYDRPPVSSWVRGVVTLAGDAASPIPPNLGQGGNKALEDAGVLVECIRRFRGDVPAALQLYQRLRVPRAAALLGDTRKGGEVSGLDSPLFIAVRNALLRAFVGVTGGLPLGWLWSYDTKKVVREARL
ncbi:hypothetical protein HYH02_001631 [Chlamydomonas schloesseri]|uniref:FAD-binding domain-containing protein n=1 Tax=Chlamydomonas schloesseri TaxID=2026947 RepID=A0A835WUA1_9CHLO|nr:hypothetical protein HYH02_001631 [Chlamydomonas schloesseri]|eukprot:KAG2453408.1 hypothetical protein HYH02_001631 [Chlamydomonas schloesseri]